MSPGCFCSFAQSRVLPSSLGGVPVFSLPNLSGKDLSFSANLLLGLSPFLPPGFFFSPVCITPPKKVPVVSITLSPLIFCPSCKTTPVVFSFLNIRSSTDPSIIFSLSVCVRSCSTDVL